MADSIKIYTTELMAKAYAKSASYGATGAEKKHLTDNNPKTHWTHDGTANSVLIVIDCTDAVAPDGIMLLLQNYTAAFSLGTGTDYMVVEHSPDDSTYTPVTAPQTWLDLLDVDARMRLFAITSAPARRYWRVGFAMSGNVAIKIAGIFLYTLTEFTIGNEWPENDGHIYANRQIKMASGGRFVSNNGEHSYRIFPRQFVFADANAATDMAKLQTVFDNSKGSLRPFIYNENTDVNGATLARLVSDKLDENQVGYLQYRPLVTVEELPFIDDGDII